MRGKLPEIHHDLREVGLIPARAGKPLHGRHALVGVGLIPARAGKTTARPRGRPARTAHPRACGENIQGFIDGILGMGSSPRVRGKPRLPDAAHRRVRLIPARAGKTSGTVSRGPPGRAHPRACGENAPHRGGRSMHEGSSPRVRGKLGRGLLLEVGDRLIPARAGKTPSVGRTRSPETAHPRACGENQRGLEASLRAGGSSPARAGKTLDGVGGGEAVGAHPRACGENGQNAGKTFAEGGSSPRVRGKPPRARSASGRMRLIPARAGKTRCRPAAGRQPPARPRACGENLPHYPSIDVLTGSSPRVRGKPNGSPQRREAGGLIPARAGKTTHP